jgi:hypothetical protein
LREDVLIGESVTEMVRALRALAFFSVVAIVSNLSTNERTNVAHIFVATTFYFVKKCSCRDRNEGGGMRAAHGLRRPTGKPTQDFILR